MFVVFFCIALFVCGACCMPDICVEFLLVDMSGRRKKTHKIWLPFLPLPSSLTLNWAFCPYWAFLNLFFVFKNHLKYLFLTGKH